MAVKSSDDDSFSRVLILTPIFLILKEQDFTQFCSKYKSMRCSKALGIEMGAVCKCYVRLGENTTTLEEQNFSHFGIWSILCPGPRLSLPGVMKERNGMHHIPQ